jgi:hypothetical protein
MARGRFGSALRSTLAILSGIVTLTALSFGIEAIARAAGVGSGPLARLFMFGYGAASIAAGGAVTAWVAGRAPMLHALLMGVTQTLLTIWAAIAMSAHAPASSWLASIIMALPATILGGWGYVRLRRRTPGSGPVSA